MSLDINVKKEKNLIIITVQGALDANNSPLFEKKLNETMNVEQGNLIIDLKGVTHISSAGFGAMMPVKNLQDKRNHKMVLSSLNDNVNKVFRLLGFSNVLKAYASVDEAKKAV